MNFTRNISLMYKEADKETWNQVFQKKLESDTYWKHTYWKRYIIYIYICIIYAI